MFQQTNTRPSKMPHSLPMYISLLLAVMAIVPLLATVLSLEFILRPALIGQVKDALCGFSQGKGDEERTSLAFGTLNPDAPTMSLHQLLGQIQPDAEATDARFAKRVRTIEALKDLWQIPGSDPNPLIFHPDHDLLSFPLGIPAGTHSH